MQVRGDGGRYPEGGGQGPRVGGPGGDALPPDLPGGPAGRAAAPAAGDPPGPPLHGEAAPSSRPAAVREPAAGVWRAVLPAVDASVPRARHLVRDLLRAQGLAGPDRDEVVQTLLLIASELVTNAVRHAAVLSPQLAVEVVIGGGWVRVSVEDGHPYRPSALQSDVGRTGGRGLLLVRAMVSEYGGRCDAERTPDGGKAVWAALPLPSWEHPG